MNRSLAALSLALLAVGVTTACAPSSGDVEENVLSAASEGSTLPIRDLLFDDGAERFTIACPYEAAEDVAARLDVDAKAVPDLSDRDDAQALVVVTADGIDAGEFPRDRVDLCSTGDAWPVYQGGDETTLTVTQGDDDVYVVTR
ncbi:hypothetical protein ACIGEP_10260 [Microbacterium sp. NPDC077663]|uniref:hypothetical protein n=1 Tax=Microbacterium sp. NPDC077663 TaxID=3364189 RepID=UPI0037C585A7